jgi:hypothetical protein
MSLISFLIFFRRSSETLPGCTTQILGTIYNLLYIKAIYIHILYNINRRVVLLRVPITCPISSLKSESLGLSVVSYLQTNYSLLLESGVN